MRYIVLLGLCVAIACTWARLGHADEGGKDLLRYPTEMARPLVEWPWTVGAAVAQPPLEGIIVFPLRVLDFIFYPPSYYWDYATGDFWTAHRRRPIIYPEVRPLPAMPRKMKDSEQPRLLPDSLRPEAPPR